VLLLEQQPDLVAQLESPFKREYKLEKVEPGTTANLNQIAPLDNDLDKSKLLQRIPLALVAKYNALMKRGGKSHKSNNHLEVTN
jgi:hypothetical protein